MSEFWDSATREKIMDIAHPHTLKMAEELGQAFPEHKQEALLIASSIMLASRLYTLFGTAEENWRLAVRLHAIFQPSGFAIAPLDGDPDE